MPWPVQRHEVVFVTQIRSLDIGRDNVIQATGLRESAMLTEDENILEIKFAVQYRLTDARAYLFESKNPTDAVAQAAETAVREVEVRGDVRISLEEHRAIADGKTAGATIYSGEVGGSGSMATPSRLRAPCVTATV